MDHYRHLEDIYLTTHSSAHQIFKKLISLLRVGSKMNDDTKHALLKNTNFVHFIVINQKNRYSLFITRYTFKGTAGALTNL